MTLKDISNGPDWMIWLVFIIFAVISILLLTGNGANLIAGYNTADEEEKNKYDTKKMCSVVGISMTIITIMIFIMGIGESVLPAFFSKVFLVVTVIDCIGTAILVNTICKK